MSYFNPLNHSLRKMQKYYGLDVTGEADSATLNLMKKKRCGAKDMEYGKSKKHLLDFLRF